MITAAYSLAGHTLLPIIRLAMINRVRRGRDDANRVQERFGFSRHKRPPGPLIWFHAAGVHDIRSLIPLARLVRAHGVQCLLTTPSRAALTSAEAQVNDGILVQYAPLDVPRCINRFLDHWQPDLSVTSGSELWPTTISRLRSRGISHIIVSASLSDRAHSFWQRWTVVSKAMFNNIDCVMAQTETDAHRFGALGAGRSIVTGDLRLDMPVPPTPEDDSFEDFKKRCETRPVWTALSCSVEEATAIAEAHGRLKATMSNSLCLIVPNHFYEASKIEQTLRKKGVQVGRFSRGDTLIETMDAFILDDSAAAPWGPMIADTAFIGRSLDGGGGTCPVDAIVEQCALVAGQDVFRQPEFFAELYKSKAAHFVSDSEGLANFLTFVLNNEERRIAMCGAAFASLNTMRGALELTYLELDPYIRPLCYQARMETVLSDTGTRPVD